MLTLYSMEQGPGNIISFIRHLAMLSRLAVIGLESDELHQLLTLMPSEHFLHVYLYSCNPYSTENYRDN